MLSPTFVNAYFFDKSSELPIINSFSIKCLQNWGCFLELFFISKHLCLASLLSWTGSSVLLTYPVRIAGRVVPISSVWMLWKRSLQIVSKMPCTPWIKANTPKLIIERSATHIKPPLSSCSWGNRARKTSSVLMSLAAERTLMKTSCFINYLWLVFVL